MSMKPSLALLAVLAVIAAPAFAQDSEAPAEDAATADSAGAEPAEATADDATATDTVEPAPEAAETADDGTEAEPASDETEDSGETASDEPKTGSYYVNSTFQDWTIRCIRAAEGEDPCELYQLMKDEEGNSVAEMTVIPLKNGDAAAGATLVAPLETDLIQGLGLAIDNAEPRGYPFSFCAPVGCVSRMGFTATELGALKRGNKATVTLLPFGADPKKPVRLNLSLSGFTAAMDELGGIAGQ